MKKAILFITIALAIGGTKNNNSPATPTNPTTNLWKHFIPNWRYDTLIGATGIPIIGKAFDTIITKSVNDTSFIIHKGKQYYLWTEATSAYDSFKTDQLLYGNCVISPTLKSSDNIAPGYQTFAYPFRHIEFSHYDTTKQLMMIGNRINFDTNVNNGIYTSIKQ